MTAKPRAFGSVRFEGFIPIVKLWESLSDVPENFGVYQVLLPSGRQPRFLSKSPAGHFKGKDPTVAPEVLRKNWVLGTRTLYIGKAEGQTLRKRIRQYLDFGRGKAIGHRGGRFIWQLVGARNLIVCWRVTENAGEVESRLLKRFETRYGRLPFANLKKGTA